VRIYIYGVFIYTWCMSIYMFYVYRLGAFCRYQTHTVCVYIRGVCIYICTYVYIVWGLSEDIAVIEYIGWLSKIDKIIGPFCKRAL